METMVKAQERKLRILIINTLIEGTSTAKIATGLYKKLKERGYDCLVLYGVGDESNNNDFVKIATNFDIRLGWIHNQMTGVHGALAPFPLKRVKRILDEFRPDIVQLFNLHHYYMDIYGLFDLLKKNNIPTVYSMLDEYPYLGYCCYAFECLQFKTGCQKCNYKRFRNEYPRNLFVNGVKKTIKLKEKAYENFPDLVFTGPKWVLERAKSSYLLKTKKMVEVDEFIDTEHVFVPKRTHVLKEELGLQEKIIILNVAPSRDIRKGVKYYIELAKRVHQREYVFLHIGYQGDTDDLPNNFIPISYIKDQSLLAQYYAMADLFVCTSLADTMPNTCLDALACGTPVLGFNITGVPYVAEKPFGRYVEPGNVDALEKEILKTKSKDEKTINGCRNYALGRYSPDIFCDKLEQIYNQLLGE